MKKQSTQLNNHLYSSFRCVAHKQPYIISTGYSSFNCINCGAKSAGKKKFICSNKVPCSGLCLNCRICRQGHNLGKIYSLAKSQNRQEPRYSVDRYICTNCGKQQEVRQWLLRCLVCNFNFCRQCQTRQDSLCYDFTKQ